jgi:hypothetical protein
MTLENAQAQILKKEEEEKKTHNKTHNLIESAVEMGQLTLCR